MGHVPPVSSCKRRVASVLTLFKSLAVTSPEVQCGGNLDLLGWGGILGACALVLVHTLPAGSLPVCASRIVVDPP